ncbi:MAG: FAD:protein FMN transferase [Phycisphaeraceae bacterium]
MNAWYRWPALVVLLVGVGLAGWWMTRGEDSSYERIDGEIFATHYRITYRRGADVQAVRQAVEAELNRIDQMASTWKADSELMRYNRAEAPERVALSPELSGLLKYAEQIESQTSGSFSLRPDGSQIDLSGIAKGYAVDRVVAILERDFEIDVCLVDIGGEVKARGDGPSGNAWRVQIYLPSAAVDLEAPTVILRDNSIATSGAYFKGDHIINPATGKAVVNELISVSVIHKSSTTADALATALYVMGPVTGMRWAKDNAIHAIFIFKDGTRQSSVLND